MLHQAIQVRLYSTQNQQIEVASTFWCVRWWSNYGLTKSLEVYKKNVKKLGCFGFHTLLQTIPKLDKTGLPDEFYSKFLQVTTLKLTNPYKFIFDGFTGFYNLPLLDKKQSFQYPQNLQVVDTMIFRYRGINNPKINRLSEEKINNSTISKKKYSEKSIASILTEIKAEKQTIKEGRIAGSDLVLKYLAIVPDDEKVSKYDFNAKHFAKHEKKLKRNHQKLREQQKKSDYKYKYSKAGVKVCERFRNLWQNFLHKLSYKWVGDRLAVIVENFQLWGRIRNSNWAKAILDEVLGSLTNFLAYKLDSKDGNLVEIDRWYFSYKLCSNCFHQMTEMPLEMREGTCPHCATDRDREGNAARKMKAEGIKILKAEGSAVSALGREVRPKLGRKSQLRHSPMSTEAPTIFGTTI